MVPGTTLRGRQRFNHPAGNEDLHGQRLDHDLDAVVGRRCDRRAGWCRVSLISSRRSGICGTEMGGGRPDSASAT